MNKLPAKSMVVVMPFLLSIIMSCVISFISTVKTLGFSEGLVNHWLQAWGISWLVAFPVVFFVLPLVRKIAALIVEKP
jgi:Protein of unknown function (DUF2798)